MSKKAKRNKKKFQFACFVADKKEILFGQFSNIVTHKAKTEAWDECVELCFNLGLIKVNKDKNIGYVKNLWGNMKKRAIERKNFRNTTGAGRDKSKELDETDMKVIDIIGENAPIISGLGLAESSGRSCISNTIVSSTSLEVQSPNNAENITVSSKSPVSHTLADAGISAEHSGSSQPLPYTPRSSRFIFENSSDTPRTPKDYRQMNAIKRKSNPSDELAALKKQKYESQNAVLLLQKKNLEMQQILLKMKLRKQQLNQVNMRNGSIMRY